MAAASTSGNPSWSSTPSSAPISLHYPPQRFAAHYSTYHHPQPMPSYHQLEASTRSFSPTTTSYSRPSYDSPPTTDVDRGYTSHLPPSPKKRSRSKLYPSEEARVAAKLVQKAKRREQNRNAQRRLRDRKEEHIFKLEGEVAELRRDSEERRGLEEMVRRLVEERDELRRRLDEMNLSQARGLGIETGGYSSSGGEGDRESKESSVSSASIGTPRSPNSPPSRMGSLPLTPRTATFTTMGKGSPTQLTLPRIKMSDSTLPDSMMPAGLLPPVSAFQWNLH